MRGKGPCHFSAPSSCRITPAYAGKSNNDRSTFQSTKDHPRLCGEKQTIGSGNNKHVGSPPPMRGKAVFSDDTTLKSGITPAYAGKSGATYSKKHCYKDHPRLCGEKLNVGHMKGLRNRITPAYAGKRFVCDFGLCNFWDHPRLCGEKCSDSYR